VAVILLAAFGTSRIATLLHEVAGHGGAVAWFGGELTSVSVSWFGGGWAEYTYPAGITESQRWWMAWSGIWVNLATGLVALIAASMIRSVSWRVLLAMFAVVSLLGGFHYWILGAYWSAGDPVAWTDDPFRLLDSESGWWIGLATMVPFGLWLMARVGDLCAEWVPMDSARDRLLHGLSGIAAAMVVYAGLLVLVDDPLQMMHGGEEATERLEVRSRDVAIERETRRRTEEASPSTPPEVIRRDAVRAVDEQGPAAPIRSPWSILIWLGLVYAGWGIWFIVRTPENRPEWVFPGDWIPLAVVCAVGMTIAALFSGSPG
jgi:hypothetical protein